MDSIVVVRSIVVDQHIVVVGNVQSNAVVYVQVYNIVDQLVVVALKVQPDAIICVILYNITVQCIIVGTFQKYAIGIVQCGVVRNVTVIRSVEIYSPLTPGHRKPDYTHIIRGYFKYMIV